LKYTIISINCIHEIAYSASIESRESTDVIKQKEARDNFRA